MECIFVTVSDDSVASVGTTVESGADIEVFSEDVDEFTFAFVAPLGAEDDCELGFETCVAGWYIFGD